jgi:hypothetical protein
MGRRDIYRNTEDRRVTNPKEAATQTSQLSRDRAMISPPHGGKMRCKIDGNIAYGVPRLSRFSSCALSAVSCMPATPPSDVDVGPESLIGPSWHQWDASQRKDTRGTISIGNIRVRSPLQQTDTSLASSHSRGLALTTKVLETVRAFDKLRPHVTKACCHAGKANTLSDCTAASCSPVRRNISTCCNHHVSTVMYSGQWRHM